MGLGSNEKARDSVKDGKSFLNTSEEKKESKWENIDWSKPFSEEKEEIKWDKIDWGQDNLEKKEKTKWDTIDFSKDHSSEEKKIKGHKNDNIDDTIMTDGENNIKINNINFNDKENDDIYDDLSRQTDFIENTNDDGYHQKEKEEINDNLEEKRKDNREIDDNKIDYESNLTREGTETILFPSEHSEEKLDLVKDYESENNSEQKLEGKHEEIDEYELVVPEGKPEKNAEPLEIRELMAEGNSYFDYISERKPEMSPEIEPKNEPEDHPEQEFLNESEDRPKKESEKDLELINPETGEPIHPQPDWKFIPLQDYLEQLLKQQENRDETQKNEADQEKIRKSDKKSELMSEQDSGTKPDKKSEKLLDQKSEFIQDQESKYLLKHSQEETDKIEHITDKKNESLTNSNELKESKQYKYQQLIKKKYKPIFSQIEFRKTQKKSKKFEKETEISQKTKNKSRTKEIKEINLIIEPTLAKKKEESNEVKVDYSSEQDQRISTKIIKKDEELDRFEILEKPKQEELKENQKIKFISSEILELQERYHQETGKRPIYNKKQTTGFKEWLKIKKESAIIQSESNRKGEIREGWELLLEKWIIETNERDISQELKEELLNIIKKYHQCRRIYWKLIQLSENKELTRKKLEEIEILIQILEDNTIIQKEIFKILKAFRAFYNENIRWYKNQIVAEKHKFLIHLSQKLSHLKGTINPQKTVKKNWKELLRENLYKNTTLNLKKNSLIIEILKNEKLNNSNKNELISILSKLHIKDLISLLGNEFKRHTQNYVKWGWNYDQGLKRIILRKYMKKSMPQILFNDGTNKECGICHKIKTYEKFARSHGGPSSICKKCYVRENSLRSYRKKIKLIKELFNEKCNMCNTNIIKLPALEFHHIDPSLKTNTWGQIRNKSYQDIIRIFKNEKTIVLCSNCHSKINRKLFNSFKRLILMDDLFNFSPEFIDILIMHFIDQYSKSKKLTSERKRVLKHRLKQLIKKRSVIEQLFEGKCIGCGEITSKNNILSLQFHHLNQSMEKKITWHKIRDFDIKKISKILKDQNCYCLCANCHKLLHSKYFHKSATAIMGTNYDKLVKLEYNKIMENIDKFKFKNNAIIDNLKYKYKIEKTWLKYLRSINKLSLNKTNKIINERELRTELNVQRTDFILAKLLKYNFIEITNPNKKRTFPKEFKLTKKGKYLINFLDQY